MACWLPAQAATLLILWRVDCCS